MKLYATVTSERATKGQGGNECLKIIVLDEYKTQKARFDVTNDEDGFILDFLNYESGAVTRLLEQKGEKQKGEQKAPCLDCEGKCSHESGLVELS